jgi:hypothetical protein
MKASCFSGNMHAKVARPSWSLFRPLILHLLSERGYVTSSDCCVITRNLLSRVRATTVDGVCIYCKITDPNFK